MNVKENGDKIEYLQTAKREIIQWIKKHKAQLIFWGLNFLSLILAVVCIKNKQELDTFTDNLKAMEDENMNNTDLASMSDLELDTEREKTRIAFLAAGGVDDGKAEELQERLYEFDEEISRRAWNGEEPCAPSYHREHGWYLPNDD